MVNDEEFDIDIENRMPILNFENSDIPSYIKHSLETLEMPAKNHQDFLLVAGIFKFKKDGILKSPSFALKGCTALTYYTILMWIVSLILMTGATANYYILEQLELYATSHDSRIERVSTPIKLSDL